MTCIAGIKFNQKVYIGGDSVAIAGYQSWPRKDRKVFKTGEFLIGTTGSPRAHQLLQFNLSINIDTASKKKFDFDNDIFEFMCTNVVDEIRKILKKGGLTQIKDGVEECDSHFLIGIRDRLFAIYTDFQVAELTCNYMAVGCGDDFAMGSMFTTQHLNRETGPKEILTTALKAASEYSSYVGPPYHILST